MSEYVLEMNGITKEFPGVKALDNVELKLKKGTILGLVGENGAGKSTLMKVLSGVYPYGTYQGTIRINGESCQFKNVKASEAAGISIIYQELMLFPELTIAENIALPTFGKIVNRDKIRAIASEWMKKVGLVDNPETLLKNIGIGKQQLVEIAKALSLNAKILILDEPSAALTENDTERLLNLLRNLRETGVSCIYISHKLNEVMALCDDVVVLRDGKSIGSKPVKEIDEQEIIKMMVGRDVSNRFPPRKSIKSDKVLMEVKNINMVSFDGKRDILKDVNFFLKEGEILGIAGLMGAGRTELVNGLFGDFKGKFSGEIYVEGIRARIRKPKDAIKYGIGLLTEDRKHNGLNLIGTVEDNVISVSLSNFSKGGIVNENQAIKSVNEIVEDTHIKAPSLETLAMNLSGGNQQKVVIAKWMLAKPKILIFDEPTRGIDVGAKYEIYNLMNELKSQGIGIIMVSSELPEILGMSDRILVLNEGQVKGMFDAEEADEFKIMERLV